MKLLACDYDNTLNTFGIEMSMNIEYIKKFLNKGNIFVLNTGRGYESIKREINKYKIPYTYLACYDGSIIFDNKGEIIYCNDLPKEIGKRIIQLKEENKMLEIEPIYYQNKLIFYTLSLKIVERPFLLELEKICLMNNLAYEIYKVFTRYYFYVHSKDNNKAKVVEILASREQIAKEDIYTIGDNSNDLEMIKQFNGYTLPWGKKEVKEHSQDICISVASLIKKITK